jgi:hypothetical protein
MVFDGFPKKNRNKTFYFHTKKKYCFYFFLLSFGPRVHFQGKKLNFCQKNRRPKTKTKILITLFISLKVAHSAQEAPKKNSARWLIKKLKTIEVGFNDIGCAPALFQRLLKKCFYWPPTDQLYGPPYIFPKITMLPIPKPMSLL